MAKQRIRAKSHRIAATHLERAWFGPKRQHAVAGALRLGSRPGEAPSKRLNEATLSLTPEQRRLATSTVLEVARLEKARALTSAAALDQHLDRLAAQARHKGWPESEISRSLEEQRRRGLAEIFQRAGQRWLATAWPLRGAVRPSLNRVISKTLVNVTRPASSRGRGRPKRVATEWLMRDALYLCRALVDGHTGRPVSAREARRIVRQVLGVPYSTLAKSQSRPLPEILASQCRPAGNRRSLDLAPWQIAILANQDRIRSLYAMWTSQDRDVDSLPSGLAELLHPIVRSPDD